MWIDQFLIRHSSNKYYCEPDNILLSPVDEESKKEFYRVDMAQMLWNLLERRIDERTKN